MKDGKISERGNHKELINKENGEYLAMLSFDQSQQDKAKMTGSGEETDENAKKKTKIEAQLRQNSIVSAQDEPEANFTQAEEDVKQAGWSVLLKYFKVTTHFYLFFSSNLVFKANRLNKQS